MPFKYFEEDPLWYRDAVIYELHVKSFADSNEDGIGDFRGLIGKLDYLEELGITAIWLLPFFPSPLRDDGYDIARYFAVHPQYGTLADFREFLRQAHKRGIRVIIELVMNHTSDEHSWFQQSRTAPAGTKWRNYYVWSDTPEKYPDARIIFKDFESSNWSWDPVAKSYYWHRFYTHQPDLNFDSVHVQKSMFKVVDNWLGIGVDGMRLDAIPYLYEQEHTNCENLPETHAFLKKLRKHVDDKFRNRMLLGEANQWPEDAAEYFGRGDECHMAFHFPLMPRLFMALQMEDRFPIVDILDQTPGIPETCQWGMFLRNHDELTLEMVTDEERDYMYRVYARDQRTRINLGIRRRLAPLAGNSRRKIELMNILLFSLPGTPIIYYGDEIGMGDNYYLGDRNGVRTPMQWRSDRNAGFSKANPQKLFLPVIIDPEYHYEALNVENQERNPSSLLWWTKRVIAMRKRFRAFSRGDITFPASDNPKVLVFTRSYEGKTVLVVINLSRFSQVVEIDLSKHHGASPVEVFSRNRFPAIRESPYVLTLGFHDYYWFFLEQEQEPVAAHPEQMLPELSVKKKWTNVLDTKVRERLEEAVLPLYIRGCRWFGGKARTMQRIKVTDTILLDRETDGALIALLEVSYTEGSPEAYLLPLAFAQGEQAAQLISEAAKGVIARVRVDEEEGVLYDAVYSEKFRSIVLRMIVGKRQVRGRHGEVSGRPGRQLRYILEHKAAPLSSQVLRAEQSNTSLLYDNRLFLKLYRRLEEGMNPDVEVSRFLTERAAFPSTPSFAGVIEYRRPGSDVMVMGQLQGFVPNQGDGWTYTLDAVRQYFERVLSLDTQFHEMPQMPSSPLDISAAALPQQLNDLIGGVYLEAAMLLGRRTAEMHRALASARGDPAFEPETFSFLYQRSMYQSMRNLSRRVFHMLQKNMKKLPEGVRDAAARVFENEQNILGQFRKILETRFSTQKIRYHGDFHLGQVLYTGKDFIIIDFEGEPARALSERRLKHSPLRDVAGMIRSFHYAVYCALLTYESTWPEEVARLEPWAEIWYRAVSGIYLNTYLFSLDQVPFVPRERREFEVLLRCSLMEKAVYELGYELNNRPDWIIIPVRGIEHILKGW